MLPSLGRLCLIRCTADTGVAKRPLSDGEDDDLTFHDDTYPNQGSDSPILYFHDYQFTTMVIPDDFGKETIEYFNGVVRWGYGKESYIPKYDHIVNFAHSVRDERSELLKSIMFGDDVFVFQSLGPVAISDATVSIARIYKNSVMLTKPNAPGNYGQPGEHTAMHMKSQIESRFAWQPHTDQITCGSYNCFFPDVDIDNNTDVSEFIRSLIFNTFPESSMPYPTAVAVRGPIEPDEFFDRKERLGKLAIEFDELLLTLEMARRAITPPVYGAMPVQYYKTSIDLRFPVQTSFVYFTEAGWTDLGRFINRAVIQSDNERMSAIGNAILVCCEKAALAQVVLTDIKTNNMVIKDLQSPHDSSPIYDVRMIDFGSAFSVVLNQLPDEEHDTTNKCIFFVNALLLLNYSSHRHRRLTFKRLALEAVASWRYMKAQPNFNGFCAFLNVDKKYIRRFSKYESLSGSSVDSSDELYERLAQMFYINLRAYGNDEVTTLSASGKSYVDVVVDSIAKHWELEESDVQQVVDAMEDYM